MLTMQVIGNMGKDPEEKTVGQGTRLCNFSLASNKKIKGEKVTTWVNVTVFDPHKIDFVMRYCTKGTKLFIEGEPQARAWVKDGEANSSLDCTLSFGSKIEICSSDNAGGDTEQREVTKPVAKSEPFDDLDDDIPGWE